MKLFDWLTQPRFCLPSLPPLLSAVALLGLTTGCQFLSLPLQQRQTIDLSLQVQPVDAELKYQVTGNTNLPDQTPLTVAALRYLHLDETDAVQSKAESTYAILDYEVAEVRNGTWQAALNLEAQAGQPYETWQLEQTRLGVTFQPEETVIFLATLAPPAELSQLEDRLNRQRKQLAGEAIRMTSEGQRYLQVSQTIAIAPPSNPGVLAQTELDHNGGWGQRYLLIPESPNPIQLEMPEQRQTNAPPTTAEFLQ